MADLVERFFGEPYVPHTRKIHGHDFAAAGVEILNGRLTVQTVKTFLQMTTTEQAEFDAIIATAPPANQAASRGLWLAGINAILMLLSEKYPGYDTPANVRAKLGI